MATNARTFEILYIVRKRALLDSPTKFDDIMSFIANRRKTAPDIYGKAYIAPSALVPLLQRMTTGENLLTLTEDGEYEFTARGSQMADLLDGLDACSIHFMDGYKSKVCLAVLQQRIRLGQGPATPREVAAISNISLDSARRGLGVLVEVGEATEDRTARTPFYFIENVEENAKPSKPGLSVTTALAQSGLVAAEQDQLWAQAQEEEEEEKEEEVTNTVTDEEIEAAARRGLAAALAEIDEDDDGWATSVPATLVAVPDDAEDGDLLPLPLGQILGDDGPDEEKASSAPTLSELVGAVIDKVDPTGWNSVSPKVRALCTMQAQACGLSLNEFLDTILKANQNRMRVALRHTVKFG